MIDTTRDSAVPSVCLITMGCAKNEVDSAAMARRLREAGFSVTEEASSADAIIVNTCSFIQAATEESIDAIFEAASLPKWMRLSRPHRRRLHASPLRGRPGRGADGGVGLCACSREDVSRKWWRALGDLPARGGRRGRAGGRGGPDVRYVKISDGCDRFCSYCTIPSIRGRYHSFPYEQIAEDVEREIASGAREIVLIAQDTGRWGADLPDGRDLAWLVDTLAEAHPDTWFRVMYLQPERNRRTALRDGGPRERLLLSGHSPAARERADPPRHEPPRRCRGVSRPHRAHRARCPTSPCAQRSSRDFPARPTSSSRSSSISSPRAVPLRRVFPYSREEGTPPFDLPNQTRRGREGRAGPGAARRR